MNALRTIRPLALLLCAGLFSAGFPEGDGGSVSGGVPPLPVQAAVTSVPHAADVSAVKSSPVDSVTRRPEESREQFRQGRFLEERQHCLLAAVPSDEHDPVRFNAVGSPVDQQVRLQI